MVMHSQKTLPLRASTRHNDGRPIAVVSRIRRAASDRSGAAAVKANDSRVSMFNEDTKTTFSSASKRAVWAREMRAAASPKPGSPRGGVATQIASMSTTDEAPGDAFARNRIQHALDLFGACMMIAAVMVFAMFA